MPIVVAGFEPLDLLAVGAMIIDQLGEGRAEVENQYARVVRHEGQPRWRCGPSPTRCRCGRGSSGAGSGSIYHSALQLSERYAEFDAELRFAVPGVRVADPKACQCGEVLKGVLKPWECKVFGTACTPETPDRHVHGVVRGRLRRVLQLRPASRASGRSCERHAARASTRSSP